MGHWEPDIKEKVQSAGLPVDFPMANGYIFLDLRTERNHRSRRTYLVILQFLGGGFFLLNKVLYSITERIEAGKNERLARSWRIAAWVAYLIGLPPWIIIFISRHDWIAASVEASGAPAMVLGLVLAIGGKEAKSPRWLDYLAIMGIGIGFSYSLYADRGFAALSQWLETTLVIGYLLGTYLVAKRRAAGYGWLTLMHFSCGALMCLQGYSWLVAQQGVSLLFIVDAYATKRRQLHG
jgi:hypothetical protein